MSTRPKNMKYIGAVVGDVIGSAYEFNNVRYKSFDMFTKHTKFTDDSVLTIAIMDVLSSGKEITHKHIVDTYQKWCRKYPNSGYGGRFRNWIISDDPKPYNSLGNGSAMRTSPIAYFAKSEQEVESLAKLFAEVSHNHPEGIKGAVVISMCIFLAKQGKTKEEIKKYASNYYDLDFDYEDLRRNYRFDETCPNSVPQAIYCFLISKDYEDCIRTTISIGGDCDTTAAMSCAIAEAYYKEIPNEICEKVLTYLTFEMIEVIERFNKVIDSK